MPLRSKNCPQYKLSALPRENRIRSSSPKPNHHFQHEPEHSYLFWNPNQGGKSPLWPQQDSRSRAAGAGGWHTQRTTSSCSCSPSFWPPTSRGYQAPKMAGWEHTGVLGKNWGNMQTLLRWVKLLAISMPCTRCQASKCGGWTFRSGARQPFLVLISTWSELTRTRKANLLRE